MSLTKDRIFAADDRPRKLVTVPEWDGDLYMGTMTARSKEEWEEEVSKDRVSFGNVRAALVQRCAQNVEGELIFDPADIPQLTEKSALVLDKLFTIARQMNGLTDTDLDEMEKNLESDQPEDSPSDSL